MLDKRSKNILIIIGIALLVIIITEIARPKPVNWKPSYTASDKVPFGCYVLFEEINSLFENTSIEKVQKDPYEFLNGSYSKNSAYIFINEDLFFDKRQLDALKIYVQEGNTVFLSGRNFGNITGDSLLVRAETNYNILEKEINPTFFSTPKQETLPVFKKGVLKSVITEIDTLHTKALGYFITENPALKELNFVSLKFGKGKFLFHTLPEAFSNYYLLHNNENYAALVLSYIDADKIYWDSYFKSGKKVVTSPMRFIFNQEPLTWAYYLILGGLLVFVIFRGKREQRIIEVVKPLENTSVEFTRTIGNLYFQHKDYGNIIAKKIMYFLETIRSKYYINTNELNEEFVKKLAAKSGNTNEKTIKLIEKINYLKGKSIHQKQDLIELNKLIEDFRL